MTRLDRTTRDRVNVSVQRFSETGQGDLVKLRGRDDEYRLRVGDWSVIVELDYPEGAVRILRVLHRREAYR